MPKGIEQHSTSDTRERCYDTIGAYVKDQRPLSHDIELQSMLEPPISLSHPSLDWFNVVSITINIEAG